MMTSSMELFDHIRSHYVQSLSHRIEAERSAGRLLASESPFKNDRGEVVAQRDGGFPFRGDIIARGLDGKPTHLPVVLTMIPTFKTVKFRHDGAMPLVVHPFPWNAVTVEVSGVVPTEVVHAIEVWAHQWFGLFEGIGERQAVDEVGVEGVIHRLQYIEARCGPDRVTVDVDLGSSHVESLLSLLDALKTLGAKQVTIGDQALAG